VSCKAKSVGSITGSACVNWGGHERRGGCRSSGRIAAPFGDRVQLRYFEDILPIEFAAIIKRCGSQRDNWIKPLAPAPLAAPAFEAPRKAGPAMRHPRGERSPDPALLPFGPQGPPAGAAAKAWPGGADPDNPKYDRPRPEPLPCTVNGLASSGGGIRSAAVCLRALQALNQDNRIKAIDYEARRLKQSVFVAMHRQEAKRRTVKGASSTRILVAHAQNGRLTSVVEYVRR
jgi:hypothetical protein